MKWTCRILCQHTIWKTITPLRPYSPITSIPTISRCSQWLSAENVIWKSCRENSYKNTSKSWKKKGHPLFAYYLLFSLLIINLYYSQFVELIIKFVLLIRLLLTCQYVLPSNRYLYCTRNAIQMVNVDFYNTIWFFYRNGVEIENDIPILFLLASTFCDYSCSG